MPGERKSADVYLAVVERLEPELTSVDRDAALASIAISLKRIADWLEGNGPPLFTERVADAIGSGLHYGLINRR